MTRAGEGAEPTTHCDVSWSKARRRLGGKITSMEKEANMYTGNEEIIISGKGDRK